MPTVGKSIKIESGFISARGWEGLGKCRKTLMGREFHLGGATGLKWVMVMVIHSDC